MPPSLTDRTACPGLELLSCELLANPVAGTDDLALNVHKTSEMGKKFGIGRMCTEHRRELYYARKAWVRTLV